MRNTQLVTGVLSMLVFLPHQFCCLLVHFFIPSANMVEHFPYARHRAWPLQIRCGPVTALSTQKMRMQLDQAVSWPLGGHWVVSTLRNDGWQGLAIVFLDPCAFQALVGFSASVLL